MGEKGINAISRLIKKEVEKEGMDNELVVAFASPSSPRSSMSLPMCLPLPPPLLQTPSFMSPTLCL